MIISVIYFCVILISFSKIIKDTVSLNSIFYNFIFFFFGVAPLVQYYNKTFFFGEKTVLIERDFLYGGLGVIFIIIIYELSYKFLNKVYNLKNDFIKKKNLYFLIKDRLNNLKINYYLMTLITLIIFSYLIFFDLELIYSRRNISLLKGTNNYIITFFRDTIRFLPLFILVHFKTYSRKNFQKEIILILSILVLNFPTGISRYQVAIIYFPLILIYFPILKKFFNILFLLGMLIVFPYLHNFRYGLNINRSYDSFFSMFNKLHFDTFQNTLNVIKLNLITYGEQLKGALLFFIPRIFWTNKPVSSGQVLCDHLNYDGYSNIAISIFGEGYLNFGFFGIIIITIGISFFNAFIDEIFQCIRLKTLNLIYYIFIFHEFYMLRGSFNSGYIKFNIFLIAVIFFISLGFIIEKVRKNK